MLQQYAPDDEDDVGGVKKDGRQDPGNDKRCTTTEERWFKKENKDLLFASPHSMSAMEQNGNPLSIPRPSDTNTRLHTFSSSSSSPLPQQTFPFSPSSALEGPPNEAKAVTRGPKTVGRSLLHAMHQQQEDHLAHHGHPLDGKGARQTEETNAVRHLPSSSSTSSPSASGTSDLAESGRAEAVQQKPGGEKRERDDLVLPSSSRRRRGFRTVETYKPLSSGGFLDTTHGSPDRARCMTIGAIVVILSANTSSSSSFRSMPVATRTATKDSGGSGEVTGHPPSRGTLEKTSSSLASPTTQSSVLGEVMGKMKHFLPASALTDEEKTYGRFLDAALLDSLAQVTRCDTRGRALEVMCLSGKRQKLSVLAVRPAGFMEVQLFQKWKADPSSRPVQHIGDRRLPVHGDTPPPPPVPSTAGGEETRSDGPASPTRDAEHQNGPLLPSPSPSSAWWVLPHLIVRVVAKEAGGTWWGQKALVLHIDRKAERMRLVRMNAVSGASEARASPGVPGVAGGGPTAWSVSSSGYPPEDLLDVFQLGNVETVVPRVGEVGMIVLGQRKGELVVVVRRCRDEKTGDLHAVWVLPQRSAAAYLSGKKEEKDTEGVTRKQTEVLAPSSVEEPFEVFPEAICMLHQRHGKNIR